MLACLLYPAVYSPVGRLGNDLGQNLEGGGDKKIPPRYTTRPVHEEGRPIAKNLGLLPPVQVQAGLGGMLSIC